MLFIKFEIVAHVKPMLATSPFSIKLNLMYGWKRDEAWNVIQISPRIGGHCKKWDVDI